MSRLEKSCWESGHLWGKLFKENSSLYPYFHTAGLSGIFFLNLLLKYNKFSESYTNSNCAILALFYMELCFFLVNLCPVH